MKRMLSGIKPTGRVTLGNYIGAIKPFVSYQDEYEMIVFVANLHSMTIYQEPKDLRKNTKDLISLYLAAGLDPKKVTLFLQSDVLEHAQLGWYLGCMVSMGELSRMTQYKDKASKLKKDESIGAGIFNYPSLMNADILIYDPDYVPVGEDQKQHCELARDIAERFNNIYGDVFTVPEGYIPKVGARIMGLQNPEKKMSKSESDNENNAIFLLDDLNVIANKIKRAVTDSDNVVAYSPEEKPGISNLLNIYSAVTGKSVDDAVADFAGCGYGEFKKTVADAVVAEIQPLQEKFKELSADKAYIDKAMAEGAEKASYFANKTLRKVKKKIGFTK